MGEELGRLGCSEFMCMYLLPKQRSTSYKMSFVEASKHRALSSRELQLSDCFCHNCDIFLCLNSLQ